MPNQINTESLRQSALILANISEVVSGVIKEIAGNDISNSLNGSKITTDIINLLVVQRMAKSLDIK
jgi:hypothetical protein